MMLTALVAPTAAAGAPRLVHQPARLAAIGRATSQSTNWSGYAAYAAKYSRVHATWTQPAATCPVAQHQYASFWVGLDGYTSNSVEQLGTDSDCVGVNHPVYYAWYEMYPAGSVQLSSTTYPVHVGDSLTAFVKAAKATFTLSLTNNTAHWTFTTTQTSATAQKSSAEWVAEAPASCTSSGCTLLPLANFGTIKFTATTATSGGVSGPITAYTNDEIVMVTSGGTVKAQPTAVNKGFSDTWHHI
jgi:hypothetical protein